MGDFARAPPGAGSPRATIRPQRVLRVRTLPLRPSRRMILTLTQLCPSCRRESRDRIRRGCPHVHPHTEGRSDRDVHGRRANDFRRELVSSHHLAVSLGRSEAWESCAVRHPYVHLLPSIPVRTWLTNDLCSGQRLILPVTVTRCIRRRTSFLLSWHPRRRTKN
jgi:hypothetical protein